jgi:ABC-type cobalamin/Fe3+-siderophores transport system ATPase subunit
MLISNCHSYLIVIFYNLVYNYYNNYFKGAFIVRITRVNIPKGDEGLEAISMSRLGRTVLLTGKNGSGKTRILNSIINSLKAKPNKAVYDQSKKQLETLPVTIQQYEQNIQSWNQEILRNPSQRKNLEQAIRDHQNAKNQVNTQMNNAKNLISWNQVETTNLAEVYNTVYFVPKKLDLKDSSSYSKKDILTKASSIDKAGVAYLPEGTFAKIQVIQDRWFNATHPNSQISDDVKKQAISEYKKLNELISIFLNTSIRRTVDDEATLFGFPLGQSKLSDGQKVLLQFCLAVYSQETSLKDLILIMDEPENHLHPSVIIDVLDKIVEYVPNGQIWIATHSIPLLAHFDLSQIWFVDNGRVQHAGKIPSIVLSSLLGDENEIAKLQDFISLPSQFATSRFAFESLFDTKAVETDFNDPQSVQIHNELLKLSSTDTIRVLDFGAGKGRIISNIFDLDVEVQKNLSSKLDYIAYDKYSEDKLFCEASLEKVYGSSDKRYFNSIDDILSVYSKKTFQVVIMCNVFHEIDPKDWLELFQEKGTITELLADNGVLLLVEDYQIPIGEKPYQNGFVVLDTVQLKDLFKITESDTSFLCSDARGDGRLKSHIIPSNCLKRIETDSRKAALESLAKSSKEKIKEVRSKEKSYANGRQHGFYVQQLANATLSLSEL